jgi:hypothetical protein
LRGIEPQSQRFKAWLQRSEPLCRSILKLEEDLLGHTLKANGTAFSQHEELRRLTHDIADLKRRISDQITLIQGLAWEAQDTVFVKDALNETQETLRDWYVHRDLLLKLRTFSISSGFFGSVVPWID